MEQAHSYMCDMLAEVSPLSATMDLNELADLGFMMREISNFADGMRKDCDRLQTLAGNLLCARQAEESATIQSVATPYCTAIPKVEWYSSVPKKEKDPEKYYAITDFLGIPREVADVEAVRVHWPGWSEFLTNYQSTGKPLPEGLPQEDVKPIYKVSYRAKR